MIKTKEEIQERLNLLFDKKKRETKERNFQSEENRLEDLQDQIQEIHEDNNEIKNLEWILNIL